MKIYIAKNITTVNLDIAHLTISQHYRKKAKAEAANVE